VTDTNQKQEEISNQQKEKHAGGRPIKFSSELQVKFCDLIRSGLSAKDACSNVGITYQTFFQWRKKGEKEEALSQENRTECNDFFHDILKAISDKKSQKLKNSNFSGLIFVEGSETGMKRQFSSRYPVTLKKPIKSVNRLPNLDIRTVRSMNLFETTLLKNPFISGNIFPTDIQLKFLNLGDDGIITPNKKIEVLLSGQSRSGQTAALLLAALQYVSVPDYQALLLRSQSNDNLLSTRMRTLIASRFDFIHVIRDEKFEIWKFPSGSSITFGTVNNQFIRSNYDDLSFHFIGFDDLTRFKESDYLYLFKRMRDSSANKIPLRIFSTGSPDGRYREWVKKRFMGFPESKMKQLNRKLLLATIEDNPYMDRKDVEEYVKRLDPITKKRLLTGSWN
jgi:hypothetical protein